MDTQRSNWLKTAEYVSIATAVAGTLAAEATRQMIFASAPASLALMLNVINRRRADLEIQQQADQDISQLKRDFAELNDAVAGRLESLRQQMLTMPTAPERLEGEPQAAVAEVLPPNSDTPLISLEEPFDLADFQQDLFQMQAQGTELNNFQSLLHGSMPDLTPSETILTPQFDLNTLLQTNGAIPVEQPSGTPDEWPTPTPATPTPQPDFLASKLEELNVMLEDGLAELRAELARLQGSASTPTPTLDLTPLQLRLDQLTQQIQATPAASVPTPAVDLTPLEARLDQLAQQLDPVYVVTPLQAQLEHLNQRLGTTLTTADLQAVLADWKPQIESPLEEDPAFIFSAMRSLYERQNSLEEDIVAAVRTEIQDGLAPLKEMDPNLLQTGISQIQAEISQLQQQLQTQALTPDLTPLHEEFRQLHQRLDQPAGLDLTPLHEEFRQLHARLEQPSGPDLKPFQQELQQLNQRLEQSPGPDLTPLEAELRQLHQRLERLPDYDPIVLERRVDAIQDTLAHWKQEAETSPLKQDLTLFFSAMRNLYNHQNGVS